jgi:hypothetical protein
VIRHVTPVATGRLRQAMHEIAAKKGEFTLFALFMRADAPGRWDLVVSAPWLEAGNLKATSELVELLSDSIGEQPLKRFGRIATVPADQPPVEFILKNLPVDDEELRVKSTDLFGLEIEEAIIFRAKAPDTARSRRPAHSAQER